MKPKEGVRTEVVLKYFTICGTHNKDMKKQNIKGIEMMCTRNIIPAIIIKSTIKEEEYKFCNYI